MIQHDRKTGNRLIAGLLLCTLWLAACVAPAAQTGTSNASAPAAETRTRLIVGVPVLPEILDGQQAYDAEPTSTEQLGQALIRIDAETGKLIPDLAKSWTFSEDGKTLTVTLPANAVYSNGDPLNAQAVADALLRNKAISPYASDFAALSDVKAVDATTLELIFAEPPAAFLTVLNSAFGGPWDVAAAKKVGDKAFAIAPVASGPLMVQKFTAGSEVLLVRNEHYQTNLPLVENKGPLHLTEVLVRMIPEDVTLAGELEAGSVDMVVNAPASAVERWRNNADIKVLEARQPGIFGLVMNLKRPLFSDIHIRQAIAKAVDRDALVKVLSGAAPIHTFITPGMVAYSAEMETYGQKLHPHDVAAAQALLAGAGWKDTNGDGILEKDGKSLTLGFLIDTNAVAQEQASQVLQSQLKAIGIDLQISQQDHNAVWKVESAGEFDMGFETYGWADPDILSTVLGSDFWNHAHFDNPAVLKALGAARYILDPAKRITAYADIQRQLLDDVTEIPLWQGTFYVAIRTNVHGLVFPSSRRLFLNDVTVDK